MPSIMVDGYIIFWACKYFCCTLNIANAHIDGNRIRIYTAASDAIVWFNKNKFSIMYDEKNKPIVPINVNINMTNALTIDQNLTL